MSNQKGKRSLNNLHDFTKMGREIEYLFGAFVGQFLLFGVSQIK
jgi:hypothetical protein